MKLKLSWCSKFRSNFASVCWASTFPLRDHLCEWSNTEWWQDTTERHFPLQVWNHFNSRLLSDKMVMLSDKIASLSEEFYDKNGTERQSLLLSASLNSMCWLTYFGCLVFIYINILNVTGDYNDCMNIYDNFWYVDAWLGYWKNFKKNIYVLVMFSVYLTYGSSKMKYSDILVVIQVI